MGPIAVEGLRDISYGLSHVRIGNESGGGHSGTSGNRPYSHVSRKTGTATLGVRSGFSELIIDSLASTDGRGMLLCPVIPGHFVFI
jgi:hypothetical protein